MIHDDDDVNGHNNDDASNNDLSVNDLTVKGDKGHGHINDVVSSVEGVMSDNQSCKPGIQLLIDKQVNDEVVRARSRWLNKTRAIVWSITVM